jgi:GPH family glycoside/pentoside/hexuronide:cation symporter
VGFFYITQVGLPPRWVGWGLFAFSIWNALNDPLVGWLSDRTRTRWGRRVPYIALLSAPLAISFWWVWSPPDASRGAGAVFVFMFAAVAINDLLYTMVALNSAALLPEMFPGQRERAQVNGWRQIAGTLGMLVAVIAPPALAETMGWSRAGALLAVAIAAVLILSLFGMEEPKHYGEVRGPGPLASVRRIGDSRSGLIALGIGFLIRLALTTVTVAMPFYATYVLHLGAGGVSWIMGTALVVSLLTMQVWARTLAVRGARTTALMAQVLSGVCVLLFLAAASLVQALVAAVLVGACLAGLMIVPEVMLSDVVDEEHVRSGYRHEGVFFGAANLVNRLPNLVQSIGVGELLTASGFDAALTVQPDAVALGLRALVGLAPAVALFLGVALTSRYPLHGATLTQMRVRLMELHAATPALPMAKLPAGGPSGASRAR